MCKYRGETHGPGKNFGDCEPHLEKLRGTSEIDEERCFFKYTREDLRIVLYVQDRYKGELGSGSQFFGHRGLAAGEKDICGFTF